MHLKRTSRRLMGMNRDRGRTPAHNPTAPVRQLHGIPSPGQLRHQVALQQVRGHNGLVIDCNLIKRVRGHRRH